jgi:ArsR family transcriptional regulator, arsenate/arsenite/antimonite-responsive transcriptional repressor
MDIEQALTSFSALSQETRLRVFKLLIEYGDDGAAAGVLSEALDIPHNTLSFHLSHLAQAGLVSSRKAGRQMIYTSNRDAMHELIDYLKENCCVRDTSKSKKAGC